MTGQRNGIASAKGPKSLVGKMSYQSGLIVSNATLSSGDISVLSTLFLGNSVQDEGFGVDSVICCRCPMTWTENVFYGDLRSVGSLWL